MLPAHALFPDSDSRCWPFSSCGETVSLVNGAGLALGIAGSVWLILGQRAGSQPAGYLLGDLLVAQCDFLCLYFAGAAADETLFAAEVIRCLQFVPDDAPGLAAGTAGELVCLHPSVRGASCF